MSETAWYESFFDEFYLRQYGPGFSDALNERQVDLMIDRLGLEPGARVLDLACGHGRHAIRLAQRGMRVTGLDLSTVFLERAKADATAAETDVRWVRADMREIPFEAEFDAVVNIFTAFGYFEDDAEDARVFAAVSRALVPGGTFLIETIHRDHLVGCFQPRMFERYEEADVFVLHDHTLDLVNGRVDDRVQVIERGAMLPERRTSVRLYTLPEYRRMLEAAGMTLEAAYGNLAAEPLTLERHRLVVVARKPPSP